MKHWFNVGRFKLGGGYDSWRTSTPPGWEDNIDAVNDKMEQMMLDNLDDEAYVVEAFAEIFSPPVEGFVTAGQLSDKDRKTVMDALKSNDCPICAGEAWRILCNAIRTYCTPSEDTAREALNNELG